MVGLLLMALTTMSKCVGANMIGVSKGDRGVKRRDRLANNATGNDACTGTVQCRLSK